MRFKIKREQWLTVTGLLFPCLMLFSCSNPVKPMKADAGNVATADSRRVELGRVVNQPSALIASDLVSALSQVLKRTKGSPGIIKVQESRTKFGNAVRRSLSGLGYTIQVVDSIGGDNVLMATVIPAADRNLQTHILAIDQIALKRTYSVVNNKVTPRSSLFVKGADANFIQLDDRIFVNR